MDIELLKNLSRQRGDSVTAMSILLMHVYNRIQDSRKHCCVSCRPAMFVALDRRSASHAAKFGTFGPHVYAGRAERVLVGVDGYVLRPLCQTAVCFCALFVLARLFLRRRAACLPISGGARCLRRAGACSGIATALGGERGAKKLKYNFLDYFLFGAAATVATLLFCLASAQWQWDCRSYENAAGPMLVVYPLTYLIIGSLAQLDAGEDALRAGHAGVGKPFSNHIL